MLRPCRCREAGIIEVRHALDEAAVKLEQTLAVLHPADDLEWGVGTRGG